MIKKVKAVIIENGAVLLIKRVRPDKAIYWVFPGGTVEESDKSLAEALNRECVEELGVNVKVGEKFCDATYEGKIQRFFFASIVSGEAGTGEGPEFQEGSKYIGKYIPEWVSLDGIEDRRVLPDKVRQQLVSLG